MELDLFNDLLTFTVNTLTDEPIVFVSPSIQSAKKTKHTRTHFNQSLFSFSTFKLAYKEK